MMIFFNKFLFTFLDQAGMLVPWKYYNPLPFSPWADNTANKHLYRMCVSFTPVPIKNYKQRRTATFYYDPLGTAEAPRWRRSDICPDNTAYYLRRGQGPLPLAKKEYRDLETWVDHHSKVFQVSDPFIGSGSRKGKSGGPTAAADQAGPSIRGPVKKKKSLKKKKEADVSSFQSWEGDDLPLLVTLCAYLAPRSSQVIVLLPD